MGFLYRRLRFPCCIVQSVRVGTQVFLVHAGGFLGHVVYAKRLFQSTAENRTTEYGH